MSWPMQNSGPWNPGLVMGPDMSMGSYTPEQWAAIQQQNWQWSQWQQQYAQWQSQYGEKYTEQMQAIQAMGANMPPLPPTNAPPAPPPPDKPPPPPPHENNQPLFGHLPSQPAPVPAPNVTKQNVNSGNVNLGNQAANNSNRPFPQISTAASVNAEALKKLAEEERLFDIQFQKWEEEIEKWRKDNVNHPDKQAYKEYEEKFEACRAQLLERRQQMNKKKARLMEGGPAPQLSQSVNTVVATNINTSQPPPPQNPIQQNYDNKSTQNLQNEPIFTANLSNYMSQNSIPYQQQYNNPQNQNAYNNPQNQNAYNKGSNVSKDDGKYHSDQYPKDGFSGPPNKPTFLLASESNKKGIPGLDLVPEVDKFALKSRSDVIDITEDNKPQAPDYTKISKGINNILGDEKIMNILSMVRGQVAPGSVSNPPLIQPGQSGNYFANNQVNTYDQGCSNQNYTNQQFDNRQSNIQHNSIGGYPMQSNQQQVHRPPPLLKKNVEEQMSQNQNNQYDSNSQYGSNNIGQTFDKGYPPGRPNMGGPPPPIRSLLQGLSSENNYTRGISNSSQQNVNDFFRGLPGLNDFSRAPPGANDFSKVTPGSNDLSSNAIGANDYSRGVARPHEFSRSMSDLDQQNVPDYNRHTSYGQHNDYSRGPPGSQHIQDFSKAPPGHAERIPLNAINNIAPVANKPVRPKWVDEPMFAPSVIVEYEHKPLRLKARDFIEPVHMFDYNHKSKDDDGKKKDFEKEVDEIYSRKPNRFEKELDYGGDRYTYDYHSRDFERRVPRVEDLEDYRSRGPPRDDYDDRRRLDDDRRKFDDDRKRLDTRLEDRRRDDRDKFTRREDIYKDYGRDFHRDRGRDCRRDDRRDDIRRDDNRRDDRRDDIRRDDNRRDDIRRGDFKRDDIRRDDIRRNDIRRDDNRKDDIRRDDNRRDDIRRDDRRDDSRRNEKRGDSRNRSRSRERDSRKRGLSRDNDSDTSSKRSKDKDVVLPAKSFEQPKHVIMIDDLLELPGREMRPNKIVIILRGPPGSGKSFLAKLIRDKEAEHGGTVRIMSIDDYFMQEGEVEEQDPTTGKMIKKPTLKYEYDEQSEETYTNSLKRAFKRCLTDGYFPFVIYDAVNDTLKSYADIWNLARQNDFQVYICTMELDPQLCYKRNIHNRKLSDIEVICARFFPTPPHHIQLDATTLLQSGAITEVQMEDADDMEVVMEDAQEPEHCVTKVVRCKSQVESVFTSKWEMMDDAVQLARLDGTSKPLRSSQLSMEDYLQLDDWKPTTAKPGKKTVRWADIEERRQQEKMRAIGFVVGQTDWNRMTDPTMGSSALTQTKYIERVRRN